MVGRIGSDLADLSCLQIGDVQPSVDAGDEVEAPESELHAGDEGDCAMLIGAIVPAEMISITPLPGAPTIGVCYRQYYLYDGSSDRKSDGSTRRSKQDAEF